jgi:hypothetical protein
VTEFPEQSKESRAKEGAMKKDASVYLPAVME